jgi:hypothetical protein
MDEIYTFSRYRDDTYGGSNGVSYVYLRDGCLPIIDCHYLC